MGSDVRKEYALTMELLRRSAANSLIDFVRYVNPIYKANWHHVLIADKIDAFINDPEKKRLMLFLPPQHGKLLAHDTPILTTEGWKTHGDLVPGDYVFGRDGKPVQVIAISEDGVADVEITFTDGAKITCHENHEWVIFDRTKGGPPERIIEAKELLSNDVWIGKRGRGGRGRYQVDANVQLDFSEKELPIHPYVLGVWLGDGSTTKNCITYHPDDFPIIDKIESLGIKRTSSNTHNITGVKTDYFLQLYKLLKSNDLLGFKHIPEAYLISSRQQRLELLAGLIDTDGYVYHKNGRVTFSSCCERLIEDVRKLVLSLGWRVTVCEFQPIMSSSGIQGTQPVFQLCFNPDCYIPVVLDRKKPKSINPASRRRSIVSAKRLSQGRPGRCIQVEGGVYLAGDRLTPTHNSELASRSLPAYFLGKFPDLKIAAASYSIDLARSFNRNVQRLMDGKEYGKVFPETKLNSSRVAFDDKGSYLRNTEEFEIVGKRGGYKAVGVMGGLSGRTVDLAIIDDPVKDAIEANSTTYRDRVWDWYVNVLETRLNNKSKVILIMTRWHEDDLAGRLLQKQPNKWTVIKIPAIKEDNNDPEDPRRIGEPLWPEWHSLEKLNSLRQLSEVTFASLYQQRPAPAEGNKVKRSWFQYCHEKELPAGITWDLWIDGAYTKQTANDPTGLMVAGFHAPTKKIYIRHAHHAHLEMPHLLRLIPEYAETHSLGVTSRVRVEPKATGKSIVQMINNDKTLRLNAVEIKNYLVQEGKEARLQVAAPKIEVGCVVLVKGSWNDYFETQICSFPNATHDEFVDLLGYACFEYMGRPVRAGIAYE